MQPIQINFPAPSVNSVAACNGLAGAVAIPLNGSAVTTAGCPFGQNVAYWPAVQMPVSISSGGNLSGVNFTIVGLDTALNQITETIAGPNANTVETTNEFMVVSSVTQSATTASGFTVGNYSTGHTQWVVPDRRPTPFDLTIAVEITGAITYTQQHTYDAPKGITQGAGLVTTFNDPVITNVNANTVTQLSAPVRATRGYVSAGGGTARLNVMQPGP